MIFSLAKHAVAAATVVAVGGLTVMASQTPAQAGGFSAGYTCDIPVLGARNVVLEGWLASPGQTIAGRPTGIQLRISGLNLGSPVAIDAWSAAAWIDVGGAESASFQVTGSGGPVPAQQPIVGDLFGNWAPAAAGTDVLSVGGLAISANTAATGNVTVQCVPNTRRPVAETLTVYPPTYSGPIRTIVMPSSGWLRPLGPPYHHHHHPGWSRPVVVVPPQHHHHHPGWSRPVVVPQSRPVGVPQSRPIVVPRSRPVGVPQSRPIVMPPHHNSGWTRPITGPRQQHHHHGRR